MFMGRYDVSLPELRVRVRFSATAESAYRQRVPGYLVWGAGKQSVVGLQ